jgi:myo-inositol-1(or 4)-monophosphatase
LEDNLWIVDPIDGTTNFAHGIPLAGVIIAYARKGVVEYGCIYDPFRDEYFSAWRGKGATMNGQTINCCSAKQLKDSVVCTGSPPNISSLNACLRGTNLISSEVRTVRMLGSAAIMLAWVASGKLNAYFEADLNVWDLAAGSLIISESGGRVTDVWGNPYELKTRNIVASSSGIHDALLERLQVARMWME